MSFIYILENIDWNYENKYKYGFTTNLVKRLHNSQEQHSHLSKYIAIFKCIKTNLYKLNLNEYDKIFSIIARKHISQLERQYNHTFALLRDLHKYLVNDNGSTEFIYNDGLELLLNIIKTEFPIIGINIVEYTNEQIIEINNAKVEYSKYNFFESQWKDRKYQTLIINQGIEILLKTKRYYLELATGGGKSYIVFNILQHIKPKIIIILSPRIKISEQNIKQEYLDLLYHEYNIISKCCQSYKNVYDFIENIDENDICIWFDEAHWAIEKWTLKENEIKTFLLTNNKIKYRIFTSASPNKEIIDKNNVIFGTLYKPISIKELIISNYLSNIQPYVFEYKCDDVDLTNYIFSNFDDRNYGFSYHNNQESAYNLFNKHYEKYISKQTNIKPFLLVSDDYKLEREYTDIELFETTKNSIAYSVQKYSLGYDFSAIDFIIFSDPKMSPQDIIQCIGRGLRINKNKDYLKLLLPVFIESVDNNYNKIIEVIKYLIYDIGVDIDIIVNNKIEKKSKNKNEKFDEICTKIVNSMLLKIGYKWSLNEFVKYLKENNVNDSNYYEYQNKNVYLNLPQYPFRTFEEFSWNMICENAYYCKKDCIEKIIEIRDKYKIKNISNKKKLKFLNDMDNKIPNKILWKYYNGNKKEFLIFN